MEVKLTRVVWETNERVALPSQFSFIVSRLDVRNGVIYVRPRHVESFVSIGASRLGRAFIEKLLRHGWFSSVSPSNEAGRQSWLGEYNKIKTQLYRYTFTSRFFHICLWNVLDWHDIVTTFRSPTRQLPDFNRMSTWHRSDIGYSRLNQVFFNYCDILKIE